MTTPNIWQDKVQAIEQLTRIFRAERIAYLCISVVSLIMLLTSAVVLIVRSEASAATLTLLFGSSGLIGLSIARLLRMWERSFELLLPTPGGGGNE